MEKSSVVVIGLLCVMLVVIQSGYASGTGGGNAGANGDYYDYGSCNGVRDKVPMTSCDQCVAACANIFTKPLCTYDSVKKGEYVCTCCI
ncbi:hypothetical protein MKX03_017703 [Papaver bracteatum]|nr:hypothetical protein MKX03_017703 [Papaver bracteatum]